MRPLADDTKRSPTGQTTRHTSRNGALKSYWNAIGFSSVIILCAATVTPRYVCQTRLPAEKPAPVLICCMHLNQKLVRDRRTHK